MGILWPPNTKPNADHKCSVCDRWYVYSDSLERHMRDKHGTTVERERAKLYRERARLDLRGKVRAEKYRTLSNAVVKAARDWCSDFHDGAYESTGEANEALRRACRALEKFETGGKKP